MLNNSCCSDCSKNIIFKDSEPEKMSLSNLYELCYLDWLLIEQKYINQLKTRFNIKITQSCRFMEYYGSIQFCEVDENNKISAAHLVRPK